MARTRMSGSAASSKGMKKSGGSGVPKVPALKSGKKKTKVGKKKFGGGNPYVTRSTPAWQKQITSFISDSKDHEKPATSAAAGSARALRSCSDDELAVPGCSTKMSKVLPTQVENRKNRNGQVKIGSCGGDDELAVPGCSTKMLKILPSTQVEKKENFEVPVKVGSCGDDELAISGCLTKMPKVVPSTQIENGGNSDVPVKVGSCGEGASAAPDNSTEIPKVVPPTQDENGGNLDVAAPTQDENRGNWDVAGPTQDENRGNWDVAMEIGSCGEGASAAPDNSTEIPKVVPSTQDENGENFDVPMEIGVSTDVHKCCGKE